MGCLQSGLLSLKLLYTSESRFLCKHQFSLLRDKQPGIQWLDHMVLAGGFFKDTAQRFSRTATPLYVSTSNVRVAHLSASSPALGVVKYIYTF